jgi:hypothetical protein
MEILLVAVRLGTGQQLTPADMDEELGVDSVSLC